jgi:peptidoglycan-N-acetylglucosamine deacetylase
MDGKFARPWRAAGLIFAVSVANAMGITVPAYAQACSGNPDAIGTSRVIAVDPAALRAVGTAQYPQTLPLRDHEVVLSFDDGPSPLTTEKILDALAADCVKANFFILGEHARERPDLVRLAYSAGHTIGTHSQTHPDLAKLPLAAAEQEIDDGIESVRSALGPEITQAPFFRAPYLQTTPALDQFLVERGLMLWSIDVDSEDWRPQSPDDVIERILTRLEAKHSGIVLMHDIQPHTAAAIPMLLRELKARGYRIVHAIPVDDAATPPVAISSEPQAKTQVR